MSPRHARCVLPRVRCNGHSLLLGSYLSRIGRTENPSCSACGHSSQDTSHLILHCPATDSLRRSLFDDSLSLYDLWSRPWGVARLLGLYGLPPCPHLSKVVGSTTTTLNKKHYFVAKEPPGHSKNSKVCSTKENRKTTLFHFMKFAHESLVFTQEKDSKNAILW